MILTIGNFYLNCEPGNFVLGGWKVLLSNIITMLPHLRFCFNFKVNTRIISLVPMLSASEATLPAFGQRVRASSSVLQDPPHRQHSQRFPLLKKHYLLSPDRSLRVASKGKPKTSLLFEFGCQKANIGSGLSRE